MKFRFAHNNFNVLDLEKSVRFYREALGLTEVRKKEAADGSFILVFLGDGETGHQLELTWLRDRKAPYNLGDNEFHLALVVDDFAAAQPSGCPAVIHPASAASKQVRAMPFMVFLKVSNCFCVRRLGAQTKPARPPASNGR